MTEPPTIMLAFVVAVGLAVGSFLNVVIHRVPRGESVVRPRSYCPHCSHPIRARHNIPLLGWLLLRGRCADCKASISWRYPLVEVATAILFVIMTVRFEALDQVPALPAYLYLAAIAVALSCIDIDVRRLPNAIVLPSYLVAALLLALSSLMSHDGAALARAGGGAAVLFAFFLLLRLAYPAAMGLGDVKLAGVLGALLAYLSWPTLIVGAFAGFVLGAGYGVGLIVVRRATARTAIPFGPFMLAGALLGVFVGTSLTQAYLSALSAF